MTLAAQELCSSNIKVLDVALKYGYSSPDSFAKAFTKFHGITPSQ
ncbi:MAG: helix-turn-helix domain-containing protein, partial [Lachnospiraceae bacterium]|nr:helix-turn-helix domain-containing protein [Lachnospiraceae bacterium]